ncbi:MAG: CsbD family protein [Pirellulaceae bacterium]
MNWDQIEGNWKQFKGQVREKWGELSDDDVERINGKRDQLSGILQRKLGLAKEAAEQQIAEFETSLKA